MNLDESLYGIVGRDLIGVLTADCGALFGDIPVRFVIVDNMLWIECEAGTLDGVELSPNVVPEWINEETYLEIREEVLLLIYSYIALDLDEEDE